MKVEEFNEVVRLAGEMVSLIEWAEFHGMPDTRETLTFAAHHPEGIRMMRVGLEWMFLTLRPYIDTLNFEQEPVQQAARLIQTALKRSLRVIIPPDVLANGQIAVKFKHLPICFIQGRIDQVVPSISKQMKGAMPWTPAQSN